MDINVEAMLEAPFQEKPNEERSESPHDERHDHRDSDHRRESDRHSRHSSRRRSGSRSGSRSYRSRSHYRSRSRSPHRSRRHRSSRSPRRRSTRSRERSPRRRRSHDRRDSRRHGPRRTRSPSPPVPEEDRDRRTVFVTQLAARLTSRELDEFFSQAGRVRDAHIITDRHSRRSKGVGYVEFYDEDSVQNALAMSGQKLLGIPVLVQLSEAEKNRIALQAEQARGNQELAYQRLYVGSIHFSLTEEDIKQIFEPFGPLDFVNLHKDPETGRSKGYAFIQYKNPADGKEALEKMNGFDLAGRQLKVGLVTDKVGTIHTSSTLDDEDSAGVSLNPMARTELMQKLAARQTQAIEEDHSQSTSPAPVRPIIPIKASRTIMLNNMFNPAEETEPDWVKDLETDVKEECSKFGEVEHIFLDGESLGEVYLKFRTVEAGEKALEGLNGRWFGGKQISAVFVPEAIYNVKFSL